MTDQAAGPAGGWGGSYLDRAPCGCPEGWLKDEHTHRPGCLDEGEWWVVIDATPHPWLDRQMGRPISEPTIGHEDAAAICATVWPDRDSAWKEAEKLAHAGWSVIGRVPARLGDTDQVILASVHHPDPASSSSPGDIVYAAEAS